MKFILYVLLTGIFYIIAFFKLKAKTEMDRISPTQVFLNFLAFFAIFEYVFLDSIRFNFFWHFFGLFLSIFYSYSMYFFLRNRRKEVDVIFYKMLNEHQGRINVLAFMQITQLSQNEVERYLQDKLKKLNGSRTRTQGNIYYIFVDW
jgi:Ca2+/Na+ antiporter